MGEVEHAQQGFYYRYDHTQFGMVTLKLNSIFSCFELESGANTIDMLDWAFFVESRIACNPFMVWAIQELNEMMLTTIIDSPTLLNCLSNFYLTVHVEVAMYWFLHI